MKFKIKGEIKNLLNKSFSKGSFEDYRNKVRVIFMIMDPFIKSFPKGLFEYIYFLS